MITFNKVEFISQLANMQRGQTITLDKPTDVTYKSWCELMRREIRARKEVYPNMRYMLKCTKNDEQGKRVNLKPLNQVVITCMNKNVDSRRYRLLYQLPGNGYNQTILHGVPYPVAKQEMDRLLRTEPQNWALGQLKIWPLKPTVTPRV
jgi:hypothetical protein